MSLEVQNESVSEQTDTTESQGMLKLVGEMGYSEHEARRALSRADNNIELALRFLMDGDAGVDSDSEEDTYAAIRRRTRRHASQLRSCLMGNPAAIDYAVAALLKKQRRAEKLRELVNAHSVQFLEALLESSSDEGEQCEEGQSAT
ncbi:hypothetical protein KR222_009115 [Zaprionus bogoriensis]|nr:hypothetical protein KR222_009115 [Zaprionus bogoriensis]